MAVHRSVVTEARRTMWCEGDRFITSAGNVMKIIRFTGGGERMIVRRIAVLNLDSLRLYPIENTDDNIHEWSVHALTGKERM